MSNIYPFQNDSQIAEEASLWVARLDRGLSDEETQALRHWLAAHPKHRELLMEMADLWDRMDRLSVLSELFDAPAAQAPQKNNRKPVFWALAASTLAVALAFGLFVPAGLPPAPLPPAAPLSGTSNTLYETGIGAHSTVNLPDGTRMQLNTNTQVSVSYSAQQRLLLLKKGELLVEVAHDKQRPLRVQVGDKWVEAVGTAFSVYLKDEQDFDVIVTEGRVKVAPVSDTAAATADDKSAIKELARGEKLSVRANLGSALAGVEKITTTLINDRLLWRDGKLVFRGEALQDALRELGRYTTDTITIADPRIQQIRIAGLYKTGDTEGLLMALQENFNIANRRLANGSIELRLQE